MLDYFEYEEELVEEAIQIISESIHSLDQKDSVEMLIFNKIEDFDQVTKDYTNSVFNRENLIKNELFPSLLVKSPFITIIENDSYCWPYFEVGFLRYDLRDDNEFINEVIAVNNKQLTSCVNEF